MKLLISLDYELYFGRQIGTIEHCLINPIDKLLRVVDPYEIKLSLFVDAGFLWRLRSEAKRFSSLEREYDLVRKQLASLTKNGHDVQLHIHSHWEDCHYTGSEWHMDVSNYRLHTFPDNEVNRIVRDYKNILEEITDTEIFAYRAGGWCLQPFEQIRQALLDNNIWLDSTVYRDGLSEDADRFYDFRNMPELPWWRFNQDPLIVDTTGPFVEIPISAIKMNPLFYWKLLVTKKLLKGKFKTYGDGEYIIASKSYYFDRLFKSTMSPVTLDGVKAGLLETAYRFQPQESILNIMGHPKTLCDYSLEKLASFLDNHNHNFASATFQDFKDLRQS